MEHIIALAGNPNVGKSTIFNNLTGLHQHTGNWPGKTVTCARGHTRWHNEDYTFVDLPGTYSLMAHSAEEEAARDFICSGDAQATVAVCDATCLERNLNLVLQIRAVTERLIVCVNLCDEAKKKGIRIDFTRLSELLGVPVVAAGAARGIGLGELMEAAKMCVDTDNSPSGLPSPAAIPDIHHGPSDSCMACSVNSSIRPDAPDFSARLNEQHPNEQTALAYIKQAETIARQVVCTSDPDSHRRDQRLDRLFTGPLTGVPIMLLLLTCIFWITLSGANYPSALLSKVLFRIQDRLMMLFTAANAPDWLTGLLVEGMYRVLAWVVSVMLPPMAIFFPLFTLAGRLRLSASGGF